MSNEEKFNTKVVYDEKGDYEVMENKTENAKAKKTLGDKLGKKVEENKTDTASTGATPLDLTPKAAPTTPLEELDLKNPTTKADTDNASKATTELKIEPLKPTPKPEIKSEPAKVEPKPEIKSEPAKAEPKPEIKPAAPELKPEPSKTEAKPEIKSEPAKTEPKESLSKLSLGAKTVETPKTEEVPKAEPPKEEPKKEVISPFVLHPLAELCSKFSYNDSNFIAAVRRNLSVLAGNPQERFYAEGYKALIIHGARLLDDNGNLLIHIETAEHGHAIVKVTQSGYQDCTGSMTVGDIIMANVGGKDLCICSMAFSPKLRFMK
jgi:hypothetical protein